MFYPCACTCSPITFPEHPMARPFLTLAAAAFAALVAASPGFAQTQVRVGVIPVLGVAPIFVVDKEGWAKEAGFDFKFTTFESGPVMIQALASGTLDVYVAGVAPLGVAPLVREAVGEAEGVELPDCVEEGVGEGVPLLLPVGVPVPVGVGVGGGVALPDRLAVLLALVTLTLPPSNHTPSPTPTNPQTHTNPTNPTNPNPQAHTPRLVRLHTNAAVLISMT
jgi:hypothetical protein